MIQPFPLPTSPVSPGTPVSIVCETDSANPTADITWRRSSVNIEADDTFTITTSQRDGEYNAKLRISTLSFTATQELAGWFSCKVTGHPEIPPSGSTLVVKGKLYSNICV